MKRGGPLRRKTGLNHGKPLERKTPLRSTGAYPLRSGGFTKVPTRTKIQMRIQQGVRRRVFARDDYRCVVRASPHCSGRAEHPHHVIPRGRGGPDTDENEISVCAACHAYIHDHPRWATENGWLRSAPRRDLPD